MVKLNNLEKLTKKLKQNRPEVKKVLESEAYKRSRIIFNGRMDLGLNQTQLAKLAHITQKTVSRIEGADPSVRHETFTKVYKAIESGKENLNNEQAATIIY